MTLAILGKQYLLMAPQLCYTPYLPAQFFMPLVVQG
jgi:hypothetical protein